MWKGTIKTKLYCSNEQIHYKVLVIVKGVNVLLTFTLIECSCGV